jgi:hypothetical protein
VDPEENIECDVNSSNQSGSNQSKRKAKAGKKQIDMDSLRINAQAKAGKREKIENTMDSVDWDGVRCADYKKVC